jgi:predicted mannosyl-3-phosphoglycerate phosphatase (HAD superfamily)
LNFEKIITFGIGNGENDLSMLEAIDYPLLVQDIERRWEKIKVRGLVKVKGMGPFGFSLAVKESILEIE